MRPTVEDLQAIWLFTYSRDSLLDAAGFLERNSTRQHPDRFTTAPWMRRDHSLCAAVYGLLAATRKKGRAAQGRSPPQHLAESHEHALILRDTMIGHTDATPAKGYTATPNSVVMGISPVTSVSTRRGSVKCRLP